MIKFLDIKIISKPLQIISLIHQFLLLELGIIVVDSEGR